MGTYIGEADLYWTKTAFQNKLHSSSGKISFECTGFLKLHNVKLKKNSLQQKLGGFKLGVFFAYR